MYPIMKEYGVVQQVVSYNNNNVLTVFNEEIVRDGLYSIEIAQEVAKELQKDSDENYESLRYLKEGYYYKFVAKELAS